MSDKAERIDRYGRPVFGFVYRVAMCNRGVGFDAVRVYTSPDGTRAEFRGVQTCGSPWACPICGPKIATKRAAQVNLAIERHRAGWKGELPGTVGFITYTVQHTRDGAGPGELRAILVQLKDCMRRVKGSRAYIDTMRAAGFIGEVRALEATYGEMNGWHPHSHSIVLLRCGDVQRALKPVRRLWARELVKRDLAGLAWDDTPAVRIRKLRHLLTRCCDVRDGSYAADYLVKFSREPESHRGGQWGAGSELTKPHMKGGASRDGVPQRCEHAGLWSLLNDALDGDQRSADLWREAVLAFHGSAQLYWSKGLKERYDIPDADDVSIAAEPDKRCTEKCVALTPSQWEAIIGHNARYSVLRLAALEGADGVIRFVEHLKLLPPRYSCEYTEPFGERYGWQRAA